MESTKTQDDGASCSSISTFVGARRRIAFRQPQAPPAQRDKDKLTSPVASTSSSNSSSAPETSVTAQNQIANAEITSTPDATEDQEDKKHKKVPWNIPETSAFYEGLKLHGKDFDGVSKAMARRNVLKSREEVKAFFTNTCKTYIKLISLTEEETQHVGKDQREIFLMVNACEWKRKTANKALIVDKFRELLFEGATMVKVGPKKIPIRTPSCPSLCRYFQNKKADRVPSDLFVQLEPAANEDHNFVRRRQCNPFVRLKMNTNDRIAQLIEFLCLKWTVKENPTALTLTLWPDRSCEVASLSIQPVETDPQIAPSLNKLSKKVAEQEGTNQPSRSNETKKPYEIPRYQTGTEVNTNTKATQSITYSKPFILTDAIVAEGINFQNCKTAIIAELYCVCGLKNPIKIRYQVRSEVPDSLPTSEPWNVMIDLLKRGYGDSLRDSRRDAEAEEKNRRRAEPITKKKKFAVSESPMSPSLPALPAPPEQQAPPAPPGPAPRPTDVVSIENDDFETQLARLRKVQRKTTVSVKRQNDTAATQIIKTITRPLPTSPSVAPERALPARQLFAAPNSTYVPKKTPVRMPNVIQRPRPMPHQQPSTSAASAASSSSVASSSSYSRQPGPSSIQRMPTDFSFVTNSPNKKFMRPSDIELHRRRTENFISSLKTPDATPAQTPKKTLIETLFGEELSMSPGSTRHDASVADAPEDAANVSMYDFTDMMFQQIDDVEMSFSNPASLDITASDQVHKTYNDMYGCSQDSQDYIYSQFVKKKATPNRPSAPKRRK